jgi:hypothetical protein
MATTAARAAVSTKPDEVITLDALQHELHEAERALQENERKRAAWNDDDSLHDNNDPPQRLPLPVRLSQLDAAAHELILTQQIADWKKQRELQQHTHSGSGDSPYTLRLFSEAAQLESLAEILLQCSEDNYWQLPLFQRLLDDEFLPYCDYVLDEFRFALRTQLQQANYPSSEGNQSFLEEQAGSRDDLVSSNSYHPRILQICEAIYNVGDCYRDVLRHVGCANALQGPSSDLVIQELCRPFVERLDFHVAQQTAATSKTTTRIERLPEWIFAYLKEHVFEGAACPWQLVCQGLATSHKASCLPLDFLNEIVRLVQYILGQQQVFRHDKLVGPNSQPLQLMQAIEQLLRLDDYLQSLLRAIGQPTTDRLLRLMDVFVVGDDELMDWWYVTELCLCLVFACVSCWLHDGDLTGLRPLRTGSIVNESLSLPPCFMTTLSSPLLW